MTDTLTPEIVALGALIVELEGLHPGLAERLARRTECEATRAQVVRLRGPRATPETLGALDRATQILQSVATLAQARAPATVKRRWWG
jgi:uncharacterized protein YjeT (DUF2065 family)